MAKVDANACLEDGTTAIYMACGNGYSGVISTILQFGAGANLKTSDGRSTAKSITLAINAV